MIKNEPKKKRERRKVPQLVIRDASCTPGQRLMERLCLRHPLPEDEAILECWNPSSWLTVVRG